MSKSEIALRKLNRPLRVSEAVLLGIPPAALYALAAQGKAERLERGVFVATDLHPLTHPDLAVAALRAPRAVVCLESALFFHDMTTHIPSSVSLAVPRGDHRPRGTSPPVTAYSFSSRSYASGIETHMLDGVGVKIYSREKTLVDCFKFRNRIGMDIVLEALHDYCNGPRRVDELLRQARACRMERVMRPYLEAVFHWQGESGSPPLQDGPRPWSKIGISDFPGH